ncbi:hypothetical protein OJ996_01610 [Luteolibacter sp. GHJ8]|uniref:Uncharacterized protein n=1 Tax=Luteolibacter rhizosphaerae TaxID=2989719 RepID=A0ABT3FXD4_9BACT|nr:hypothetical protein [Luteolibacter rhizosphaerae]
MPALNMERPAFLYLTLTQQSSRRSNRQAFRETSSSVPPKRPLSGEIDTAVDVKRCTPPKPAHSGTNSDGTQSPTTQSSRAILLWPDDIALISL